MQCNLINRTKIFHLLALTKYWGYYINMNLLHLRRTIRLRVYRQIFLFPFFWFSLRSFLLFFLPHGYEILKHTRFSSDAHCLVFNRCAFRKDSFVYILCDFDTYSYMCYHSLDSSNQNFFPEKGNTKKKKCCCLSNLQKVVKERVKLFRLISSWYIFMKSLSLQN